MKLGLVDYSTVRPHKLKLDLFEPKYSHYFSFVVSCFAIYQFGVIGIVFIIFFTSVLIVRYFNGVICIELEAKKVESYELSPKAVKVHYRDDTDKEVDIEWMKYKIKVYGNSFDLCFFPPFFSSLTSPKLRSSYQLSYIDITHLDEVKEALKLVRQV